MSSSPAHLVPLLLQAHHLSGGPAGHMAIEDLSFAWSAGLHWVCGDEGSGKTSLLRLLAGDLQPLAGTLQTPQGGVFWVDLKGPEHDQTTVQACWDQLQTRYPQWHNELLQDLSEALDMERHRHKPLYMLSTGSRRKVWLTAALAAGAPLTLIDQPFASLDAVSAGFLGEVLQDLSGHPKRAWWVADHTVPDGTPATRVVALL